MDSTLLISSESDFPKLDAKEEDLKRTGLHKFVKKCIVSKFSEGTMSILLRIDDDKYFPKGENRAFSSFVDSLSRSLKEADHTELSEAVSYYTLPASLYRKWLVDEFERKNFSSKRRIEVFNAFVRSDPLWEERKGGRFLLYDGTDSFPVLSQVVFDVPKSEMKDVSRTLFLSGDFEEENTYLDMTPLFFATMVDNVGKKFVDLAVATISESGLMGVWNSMMEKDVSDWNSVYDKLPLPSLDALLDAVSDSTLRLMLEDRFVRERETSLPHTVLLFKKVLTHYSSTDLRWRGSLDSLLDTRSESLIWREVSHLIREKNVDIPFVSVRSVDEARRVYNEYMRDSVFDKKIVSVVRHPSHTLSRANKMFRLAASYSDDHLLSQVYKDPLPKIDFSHISSSLPPHQTYSVFGDYCRVRCIKFLAENDKLQLPVDISGETRPMVVASLVRSLFQDVKYPQRSTQVIRCVSKKGNILDLALRHGNEDMIFLLKQLSGEESTNLPMLLDDLTHLVVKRSSGK